MEFIYPDFAFTKYMQFILFLFNICSVTIPGYWCTSLLLKVIQKQASFIKKLLFSLSTSFFSYIFFTYTIAFINGIVTNTGRLHLGALHHAVTTPLPAVSILFYFLALKILNLPPAKCVSFMPKIYILYTCSLLLIQTGNLLFPEPSYTDPRGINYLAMLLQLLFSLVPLYLAYRILYYLVIKLGYSVVYPDHITVDNLPGAIAKNLLLCCGVYLIVVTSLYRENQGPLPPFLLAILFLGYFLLSMVLEFNKIQTRLITNQNEHLTALNNSIEEFRSIKHRFNNIIQTYGGYISIEAYDALKTYHNRTSGELLIAESYMDFSKRIPENPSFFCLLLSKLDRAKELGIRFDARSICDVREVYIDSKDFTHIVSVFLDHALENAALTPQRRVSLSVQSKTTKGKLFIISHDTPEDVDINTIFTQSDIKKKPNMGQGLAQIRSILSKYNNTLLNFTSYKNSFTVYFELRPADVCSPLKF